MNEIAQYDKHDSSGFPEDESLYLYSKLTMKHILALKDKFEREPGRRLKKHAFRKALYDIARIMFIDEDFEALFAKIDISRAMSAVTLKDFLTHLQIGYVAQENNSYSHQLELPITAAPKEIRSHHRLNINRITFVPELQQDRVANHLYGAYVTCSRDGIINYWSTDMEKQRTVQSKSPELKVQSTWITDLVSLPDVSIICTSSSERDLRFYDTTAKKFELRVMISSLDSMVTALSYTFYQDANKNSKLIFGNSAGKVRVINIVSKDRGPFKSKPKTPLTWVTWDQFAKGAVKLMSVMDIPTKHTDWVRQVSYCENLHCVISISTCSKQSMFVYNTTTKDTGYSFKVPKGFSCFANAEKIQGIATGGPDCIVRIWNPFMPSRALSILRGHHAGIVSVILQDDHTILISIDKDKCVKIWDVLEQICIQNYFGLPSSLGERTPLCTYYNPVSRQVFVASMKIVYFQVYPLMNGEYTDGVSHTKEVSVILYNSLFKLVITCGYDSFIIVWDPWKGKRVHFMREAHTLSMQGETIPVEITAATFDPSKMFLITGASDGTLKVWNFNTRSCRRNMAIEKNCEVCAIVWIKNRILVMGENRGVTEFADGEDIGSSTFKCWTRRHKEDVLCASAYLPQTLVTASYSGELVFWRLETGQPYGMFNVTKPKERIQLNYKSNINKEKPSPLPRTSAILSKRRISVSNPLATNTGLSGPGQKRSMKDTASGVSDTENKLSINALLFLNSRPMNANTGSLFAALDNGILQMWSHHPGGGYIESFKATHSAKDYVISMCTDEENNYLFTGHMAGYIKTWHMVNFGIPEEEHVHVCMPALRLKFPFLWKDICIGRAKRAHRDKMPLLLNSFNAHMKPVTGLVYIDNIEIILSCSSDGSARIWTLSGRYMGTLGTFKPWTTISSVNKPYENREYSLPADIRRSASFTTWKVLHGGKVEKPLTKKQQKQQYEQMNDDKKIYGRRVELDKILGHHFKLPERGRQHGIIILDNSLHHVPIYSEMILPEPETMVRPPTPELAKKNRPQHGTSTKKNPI